ncbi:hypothetical protein [Sphingomonas sp.]|uniref:hypothetical protein n=1 Tax=Sphingomonas sp. TaxID=28214 RepID=UPI0025D0FADE|nr:hypothetical protein [Sphingomonas sp.]
MRLAVTAAAVMMIAAPAFADDWDFILINNSGKGIKTVELAPTGTTDWQANKVDPEMKREPITKAGGRMTVHFDKGATCKYDVKLTFADDSASTWTGINICDNSFVTVKYNAAGAPIFTAN